MHITGGAQDGAARAVNLATADVTGTLPTGNQASQSCSGDVTGTTAATTVVALTGASSKVAIASTAPTLEWATATTSPKIYQADNTTNSATAQNTTAQAQNATGTSSTGGDYKIVSGTGTSQRGSVRITASGGGDWRFWDGGIGWNQVNIGNSLNLIAASSITFQAAGGNLTLTDGSTTHFTTSSGPNAALFSTGSFGSGVGVLSIANATTAPTTTPSGGGVAYAVAGAYKWKGSSGTVTNIANAEPHCPKCGTDVGVSQSENDLFGEELLHCHSCELRTGGNGVVRHIADFWDWKKAA